MSKELQALEEAKELTHRLITSGSWDKIEEQLNIVETSLKTLEIIKEIAKVYDIKFCDKDLSITFKIPYRNKFILERITFKDKKNYDLLKEVLL